MDEGNVLLDPQFYLPRCDHERLTSHEYWPSDYDTGGFLEGSGLDEMLTTLLELNRSLGCAEFVLPGLLAQELSEDWLATQQAIAEQARELGAGVPLLATVALGNEVVRSQEKVQEILEAAVKWEVQGVYVICEHPKGEYLVTDPNWLANVLDLVAGLKTKDIRVILGYCNHQMLIAALASADAICSGTWMNVRSFPPEKFWVEYQEEERRRATWCYCPQALSEYKLPYLDVAQRQGVLDSMRAEDAMGSMYVDALFSGAQPTTVDLKEPSAFRHYLQCLHYQVENAQKPSFDETVSWHEELLNQAQATLEQLRDEGVRGERRDFSGIVDVNRSALAVHRKAWTPMLRRKWQDL